MRYPLAILAFLLAYSASGCSKNNGGTTSTEYALNPDPAAKRPGSIGIVGDSSDVVTPVNGGLVLMGGGADVDAAFKWMISRSGGGDVVIIRASGADAYNSYVNTLGKVNSVETLMINSRALADDERVAGIIRNAEMLFIAGGDQSNYMKYWKNTKTMEAINYLLNVKKAPVGGTSAGCAILGELYYSGEKGSVVSAEALEDPYNPNMTLYAGDFLKAPYMRSVLTDQHYVARSRQGRHLAFLARMLKDQGIGAKGVAADERTAVCVDETGKAVVYGTGSAFFLATDNNKIPEVCVGGAPLHWNHGQKAVRVYKIMATPQGNGSFDLNSFDEPGASGGTWHWWWSEQGKLRIN
ncbi:MAG: cyanophycinase [Arcticibacter sp.]